MYEDVTYERILQRMLDRVPDSMNKREGSIIYDALAPAAVELQLMYIELDIILKETFGDSASRKYLIRRAAERGLKPYEATKAVLNGTFFKNEQTFDVPIGSRFSHEKLNYTVTEKISDGVFKLECETPGTVGNTGLGDLIPIEYIEGLTLAKITTVLIPGEDAEDTEAFRKRYFDSFDSKAYGGNIEDYLKKTNAIAGVGATKVTPVWQGGGTVKLTILDSEYNCASQTLVDTVQNLIDPTKDGQGVGIAPIGHVVTVDTPEEVVINVATTIAYENGHTYSENKAYVSKAISDYIMELKKTWASASEQYVRISQIEARIMSTPYVLDVSGTQINGSTNNLKLLEMQIPKLGAVTNITDASGGVVIND